MNTIDWKWLEDIEMVIENQKWLSQKNAST